MTSMRYIYFFILLVFLSACGGGGGSPGSKDGTEAPSVSPVAVELVASNSSLQTSGEAIELTAFVKGPGNVGLPDQVVSFSSSTGLVQTEAFPAISDKNGVVKAKLTVGQDRSNRIIEISVNSGSATGRIAIDAIGTTLTLIGEATLKFGDTSNISGKLVDGSGKPIANANVSISSVLGNFVGVNSQLTDVNGLFSLAYTATKTGDDELTVVSSGASSRLPIKVSAIDLSFITPGSGIGVPVNTPQKFTIQYLNSGGGIVGKSVNFSTTRGEIVSADALTGMDGRASVTVKSSSAGPAIIQGTISGVGQASTTAQFEASTPAKIILQPVLGAIPPNISGSSSSQTIIEATVRDAADNLVSGKAVNFTLDQDLSGGRLSTATVFTDINGRARVQYIAGTTSTAANGVVIKGVVASTSPIVSGSTSLTVNGQALFISIGMGNTISNVDPTTYSKPMSIYVTDAAGNPVGNQLVTISVIPTRYWKGEMVDDPSSFSLRDWSLRQDTAMCLNTDLNENGIVDARETGYSEGARTVHRPGNVVVATPGTLTTDGSGRASFELQYGEQYADWVEIKLDASATVAGTESRTRSVFTIRGLASDYEEDGPPAGVHSPYGTDAVCP